MSEQKNRDVIGSFVAQAAAEFEARELASPPRTTAEHNLRLAIYVVRALANIHFAAANAAWEALEQERARRL